jgi:hypothetical protein
MRTKRGKFPIGPRDNVLRSRTAGFTSRYQNEIGVRATVPRPTTVESIFVPVIRPIRLEDIEERTDAPELRRDDLERHERQFDGDGITSEAPFGEFDPAEGRRERVTGVVSDENVRGER